MCRFWHLESRGGALWATINIGECLQQKFLFKMNTLSCISAAALNFSVQKVEPT